MSETSGNWVEPSDYNAKEVCSICLEDLGTQQAIYKTPCNHLFHNDCLNGYCETQGRLDNQTGMFVLPCPLCRTNLNETVCSDVWAFKEGALSDDFENQPHVQQIYEEGLSRRSEGGRRRKRKRTNKRKTLKKRKIRKTRRIKKMNKRRVRK